MLGLSLLLRAPTSKPVMLLARTCIGKSKKSFDLICPSSTVDMELPQQATLPTQKVFPKMDILLCGKEAWRI